MMDRSTVFGLLATAALLIGVMVAGVGIAVDVFWRIPSLALVIGGAVLTTVVAFPLARLRMLWPVLRNAFYVRTRSPRESIITLVALSEIARRKGMLSLEGPVSGLEDDFLKRGVQMAIDGMDTDFIRSTMQAELESMELRHLEGKQMVEQVGRSAPTFGMIGTLIGLVVMLGEMNDPSRIGPGMAVALLTTLYGLVLANVFCLPVARKLGHRSREELLDRAVVIEGVLALQAGEHPRVMATRLQSFLPPASRAVTVGRMVADEIASGAGPDAPLHDENGTDSGGGRESFVEAA